MKIEHLNFSRPYQNLFQIQNTFFFQTIQFTKLYLLIIALDAVNEHYCLDAIWGTLLNKAMAIFPFNFAFEYIFNDNEESKYLENFPLIEVHGDYKKIIPTFGPRTTILFTETEWNFYIRYCEACAQEWHGKQQCHTNSYSYSKKNSKISNDIIQFSVL